MSPSRGEADPQAEATAKARAAMRRILAELHVLDALPDRSRMLAVDAELPVNTVIQTVLVEQHPQPPPRTPHFNLTEESALSLVAPAPTEAWAPQALSCGVVSPWLPSNVLAEVCEFDHDGKSVCPAAENAAGATQEEKGADDKQPSSVQRQWTSPDDGWGMHLSSFPMQDLEKMPMGMPVTVGELAHFLSEACSAEGTTCGEGDNGSKDNGQGRWAEPVGGASSDAKEPPPQTAGTSSTDQLDWTLAQWRLQRAKQVGEPAQEEASKSQAELVENTSRLFVEERPRSAGPVLVHRVPYAPPRPILCTDDPDASLLKAVELLLAYPELDALPIVSPVRCTVLAHLTLSYCLAYMLPRMRGEELLPLGQVAVSGEEGGAAPVLRKFDCKAYTAEAWAEQQRSPEVLQLPPLVLGQSQTLRELLLFFARTHHTGVPIVEDNGSGGVLGLISRRDLINYLDLTMQAAKRRTEGAHAEDADPAADIEFDLENSVEAVLDSLRKWRTPSDEETSGGGAMLVREKELTLKAIPLRLLAAENRKLLFVQDAGGGKRPRLLRIVSASDIWRMLIGSDEERLNSGKDGEPLTTQEL